MLAQSGDDGIVEHGHAAPSGVPLILVRLEGQIGARPVIKTSHNVVIWMTGPPAACVDG